MAVHDPGRLAGPGHDVLRDVGREAGEDATLGAVGDLAASRTAADWIQALNGCRQRPRGRLAARSCRKSSRASRGGRRRFAHPLVATAADKSGSGSLPGMDCEREGAVAAGILDLGERERVVVRLQLVLALARCGVVVRTVRIRGHDHPSRGNLGRHQRDVATVGAVEGRIPRIDRLTSIDLMTRRRSSRRLPLQPSSRTCHRGRPSSRTRMTRHCRHSPPGLLSRRPP